MCVLMLGVLGVPVSHLDIPCEFCRDLANVAQLEGKVSDLVDWAELKVDKARRFHSELGEAGHDGHLELASTEHGEEDEIIIGLQSNGTKANLWAEVGNMEVV